MAKSIHSERLGRLCALLIAARKNRGMTQAELARALGRTQSFIAKYEGGERRLDVVEFIAVTEAIGIDPCGIMQSVAAEVPGSKGRRHRRNLRTRP